MRSAKYSIIKQKQALQPGVVPMSLATILYRPAAVLCIALLPFVDAIQTYAQITVDDDEDLAREYCEQEDECDIRIRISDGKEIVIVNGDTVRTSDIFDRDLTLSKDRPWIHRRHDRFLRDGPGIHGFALFGNDLDGLNELKGLEELKILRHPHLGLDWTFETVTDRTLRKMERKARDLAKKAREADGEQGETLEAELNELLGEIFDYKLDKRRRAIDSEEKRLAKRRERLNERSAARDDIIEQRKRELLGEETYLEW